MDIAPFLKWAGGKRWLTSRLKAVLDWPSKSRLVEPFLGGGAVFFSLRPARALLADSNPDLIAAFRAIRDNPERVIHELSGLSIDRRIFETMRTRQPSTDIEKAVRLIYLNRTAFNGLYRVNRNGVFNVPFGCKPGTQTCDAALLQTSSIALRHMDVRCLDFRRTLNKVALGDVVYVDPPYTVKHDNNGFRRYNERIFTWGDQEELAARLTLLAQQGVKIVVSNAHHHAVRSLYPSDLFHAFTITRTTCMAASANSRGLCTESLLISTSVSESRLRLRRKLNGR